MRERDDGFVFVDAVMLHFLSSLASFSGIFAAEDERGDCGPERRGGGVAEERDGHSSKGSRSRVFPFEDGGLMGSLCLSTPAPAPLRAWL